MVASEITFRFKALRSPEIILGSLERRLACRQSVLVTIEFVKIFCLASDDSGLLDFTYAPSVESSIAVYLLDYGFLCVGYGCG